MWRRGHQAKQGVDLKRHDPACQPCTVHPRVRIDPLIDEAHLTQQHPPTRCFDMRQPPLKRNQSFAAQPILDFRTPFFQRSTNAVVTDSFRLHRLQGEQLAPPFRLIHPDTHADFIQPPRRVVKFRRGAPPHLHSLLVAPPHSCREGRRDPALQVAAHLAAAHLAADRRQQLLPAIRQARIVFRPNANYPLGLPDHRLLRHDRDRPDHRSPGNGSPGNDKP